MANTEDTEKIDVAVIKERLFGERAQLMRDLEIKEHQVAEDGDDLDAERGGVGNHMADDANQTSEQETMLTLETNIRKRLDQVNTALARIEEGTYGICTNCGKPISPARLEARPSSLLCIDCQQKQDIGRL
jgi:RNA polymerase-binding transcription factor